jgi:drug/metabolite transporter (DMT)-like permease
LAILILATLLSAGFGLVMRAAQLKGCNIWAVGLVNYAVGALFHGARALAEGGGPASSPVLLFGLAIGVVYAIDFGLYAPLLRMRGVSITLAMARISIIVPLLASILLWRERLTAWGAAGALLALAALPLLVLKPRAAQALSRPALLYGVALFAGTGAERTLMKAFQTQPAAGRDALMLAILFAAACLVMLGSWLRNDRSLSRKDVGWGIALGLTNALANLAFLGSLRLLPGILVFPFMASISLVFAGLFARVAWRERISRRESLGMGLALVAVTLANLG